MPEGKFTAQGSLELPGDRPRPAAPPVPEERRAQIDALSLFERNNGEEPILAVKIIDGPGRMGKIVTVAVRDPGVHRITVQITPYAAREFAARLINAAREAE